MKKPWTSARTATLRKTCEFAINDYQKMGGSRSAALLMVQAATILDLLDAYEALPEARRKRRDPS